MTAAETVPEPPPFIRTFIPIVLFTLLCGIVGPIFLVLSFVIDEPGTGWMLPLGLLITVGDVAVAVLVARARNRGKHKQYRLRTRGRPALADVIRLDDTNIIINDKPLMEVHLRIHGDDITPFDVQDKMTVPHARLPYFAGTVPIPVIVDPETREWEIDWTAARLPVSAPVVAPPQEPVADRLAELDDLLRRDLISRDEYDETRTRILGEI